MHLVYHRINFCLVATYIFKAKVIYVVTRMHVTIHESFLYLVTSKHKQIANKIAYN